MSFQRRGGPRCYRPVSSIWDNKNRPRTASRPQPRVHKALSPRARRIRTARAAPRQMYTDIKRYDGSRYAPSPRRGGDPLVYEQRDYGDFDDAYTSGRFCERLREYPYWDKKYRKHTIVAKQNRITQDRAEAVVRMGIIKARLKATVKKKKRAQQAARQAERKEREKAIAQQKLRGRVGKHETMTTAMIYPVRLV